MGEEVANRSTHPPFHSLFQDNGGTEEDADDADHDDDADDADEDATLCETPGSHASSPSILSLPTPLTDPVPPSPLLRSHLHAVKQRHRKTNPPSHAHSSHTPQSELCSTSRPDGGYDFTPPDPMPMRKGVWLQESPAPSLSTPCDGSQLNGSKSCDLFGASANKSHDFASRSCDLATPSVHGVFGAVERSLSTQSPNLMEKISSEMARRSRQRHLQQERGGAGLQQQERGGSGPGAREEGEEDQVVSGSEKECHGNITRRGVRETADISISLVSVRRRKFGDHPHYSATLGIKSIDLPRRKLRRCELESDAEPHPLLSSPSSPVVLSASLGITQLAGTRRQRKRGRGLLKDTAPGRDVTGTLPTLREGGKTKPESAETAAPRDGPSGAAKECPPKVGGIPNHPTTTPLNPPVKAGGLQSLPNLSTDTSIKAGGPLRPLNPPPSIVAVTASTKRRYKSPWRSMSTRLKYTPVKGKGGISK